MVKFLKIFIFGKDKPYAHTEEECEKLLSELIVNMKAEIQQERERLEAEKYEESEVQGQSM